MSYRVEYREDGDYIYVAFEGSIDIQSFQSMAREVGRLIHEVNCSRVLNDLRRAGLDESLGDVYFMPKQALAAGVARNIRRALVVAGDVDDYRFMETVFLNQGNIVKVFENFDEAERWLFSESAV